MQKLFFLIVFYIKIFLQYFLLIFNGPEKCILCGNISGVTYICKNCKENYFSIKEIFKNQRCKTCGKELLVTHNNCIECRTQIVSPHAENIFSIFPYRLWNKEIMFMWKTENLRIYSIFFADIIQQVLKLKEYEIIVPVPPRPGKIKEKGWDQVEDLCKLLEFKYGYKILRILKRLNKNQQKKLDKNLRLKTIGSGYTQADIKIIKKELKKNKIDLPEKVCLIDDVCTTGATIESCCTVLNNIGIKKINVVTLFKVD